MLQSHRNAFRTKESCSFLINTEGVGKCSKPWSGIVPLLAVQIFAVIRTSLG